MQLRDLLIGVCVLLLVSCGDKSKPNEAAHTHHESGHSHHDHDHDHDHGHGHYHSHGNGHNHDHAAQESILVDYQGIQVKLDGENPSYSETQKKVLEATLFSIDVPKKFKTYPDLVQFFSSMEIPGVGSILGGLGTETPLGTFTYFGVDSPTGKKSRTVIYKKNEDGGYELIDVLEIPQTPSPNISFIVNGSTISYTNSNGTNTIYGKKILKKE